jgi:hypothetical protein
MVPGEPGAYGALMRLSQASSSKVGGGPTTRAAEPAGPGVGKRTLVQDVEAVTAARTSGGAAGGGQALPDAFRLQMERAFGADFRAVRVHEDPSAAELGALAFTRGTDIHVAPGRYDPSGQAGRELLGHELAHVVQQAQGRVRPTGQASGVAANTDPALEHEADHLGDRAARGEPAAAAPGGVTAIAPAAAPATQFKLHKFHFALEEDELGDELVQGDAIEVGRFLRDGHTRTLYRYVSAFPGGAELIIRSDDGGPLFVYRFANDSITPYDQARHETALGRDINQKMTDVNQAMGGNDATHGVHYEHTYRNKFPDAWRDEYIGGYADPNRFQRHAPMIWELLAQQSASVALRSWLAGLTIAECGSVLVAIQLSSLLQVVGDWTFDQMFGSTDPQKQPTVHRLRITSNLDHCLPQGLARGAGTTPQGQAEFKLGAKYYFENHPAYLRKHPDGALAGENAVYFGEGHDGPQFAGFGIGPVGAQRMCSILCGAYNRQRSEGDYRVALEHHSNLQQQTLALAVQQNMSYHDIYQQHEQLVHQPYRTGAFPDQLTTLGAWLAGRATPIAGQGVMLDAKAMTDLVVDKL